MKAYLWRASGNAIDDNNKSTSKVIELNTLEELKDLINKYGDCIILPEDVLGLTEEDIDFYIEIYDSYVE